MFISFLHGDCNFSGHEWLNFVFKPHHDSDCMAVASLVVADVLKTRSRMALCHETRSNFIVTSNLVRLSISLSKKLGCRCFQPNFCVCESIILQYSYCDGSCGWFCYNSHFGATIFWMEIFVSIEAFLPLSPLFSRLCLVSQVSSLPWSF